MVLGRPKLAVQNKARQLGRPFPDAREVKAARLARELGELKEIGRRDARQVSGPTFRPENDGSFADR